MFPLTEISVTRLSPHTRAAYLDQRSDAGGEGIHRGCVSHGWKKKSWRTRKEKKCQVLSRFEGKAGYRKSSTNSPNNFGSWTHLEVTCSPVIHVELLSGLFQSAGSAVPLATADEINSESITYWGKLETSGSVMKVRDSIWPNHIMKAFYITFHESYICCSPSLR